MASALLQQALVALRCPHCREQGDLELQVGALRCQHCGQAYPILDGVVDFLPDWRSHPGLAQRFMEHPWIVAVYEDYFRPFFTKLGSSVTYDDELRWLQRFTSPQGNGVVLDLACGTGRYARLLADLHTPALVLAVDISLPMLKQAHKKAQNEGYQNILFLRGDAHQLPLANGVVDRLNCFGALHLFPDPPRAIAELGRMAKAGAVFTCLTAAITSPGIQRTVQKGISRLADFRFFDSEDLRRLLSSVGYDEAGFEQFGMLLLFSASHLK